MTRLFNVLAATLLAAAVWLSIGRSNAGTVPAAPEAEIVAAAARAGMVQTYSRPMAGGELFLSFAQRDCSGPVDIVYLPSVAHVLPRAWQLAATHVGPSLAIYDGKALKGLSFSDIFWPWLRRKLVMTATLAPRDGWSSVLILLLLPRDCPPPPIDWTALSRRS